MLFNILPDIISLLTAIYILCIIHLKICATCCPTLIRWSDCEQIIGHERSEVEGKYWLQKVNELGVVASIFNPSTRETEGGGLPLVQVYHRQHSEFKASLNYIEGSCIKNVEIIAGFIHEDFGVYQTIYLWNLVCYIYIYLMLLYLIVCKL